MQALIAPSLQLEVDVGDVLDIIRFEVRRASRKSSRGSILYLAIQDCDLLPGESIADDVEEGGGFVREASATEASQLPTTRKRRYSEVEDDNSAPMLSNSPRLRQTAMASQDSEKQPIERPNSADISSTQSSDEFESATVDAAATQKRRRLLQQLNGSSSPPFSFPDPAPKPTQPSPFNLIDGFPTRAPLAKATAPTSHFLPKLTLTSLASLPTLAPSTPINVLAVITWTGQSLIRPSPAFPPKRHIKLHDLSISSVFTGVTLANFIDAGNFKPARGTVVLLRGVVVQRCGPGGGGEAGLSDVSRNYMLNAYANLPEKLREKEREERRHGELEDETSGRETKERDEAEEGDEVDGLGWFVDDEDDLRRLGLGDELDRLKGWWQEWEERRAGAQSSAAG